MKRLALIFVALALVVGIAIAVFVVCQPGSVVLAADPAPQSVAQSTDVVIADGTISYTGAVSVFNVIVGSEHYGIVDFYAEAVYSAGATTHVFTATMQHGPCEDSAPMWIAGPSLADSAIAATPVFTRVALYGNCVRISCAQAAAGAAEYYTPTMVLVLKNN